MLSASQDSVSGATNTRESREAAQAEEKPPEATYQIKNEMQKSDSHQPYRAAL